MRTQRYPNDEIASSPAAGISSLTTLVLSVMMLLFVLLFPGHPDFEFAEQFLRLPIELPVLVVLLVVFNQHVGFSFRVVLVVALVMLLLLRLADIGSYLAFNRRFSPLLEFHLLADGWNLASTTIGPLQAAIIALIAIGLLLVWAWLLYRCLSIIANTKDPRRRWLLNIMIAATVTGTAGLFAEYHFQYKGPLEAKILSEYSNRLIRISQSIKDQRQFISDMQHDSVLDEAEPQFSALMDKDILLIFVESYGRGYVDAERFSALAKRRLFSVQETLSASGLSVRSGWLTSPIRGGRSWLAHSTFQSGLKIDNQARYDRLVTSKRKSVSQLFQQAGWHTVGIMPGIQLAWPEGIWYGYQDLRNSDGLGYQGERFGYVTMPDQYTLHYFEHQIRGRSSQPVMATMALLSTHAPWTPLPKMVDWDEIGDGSVFNGSQRFGERISWKYRTKVQDMYANSLDYTLEVLGHYAARYADDSLIMIMGDHQPAPIINGWGKSGDVPVHIIARNPSLLDRFPSESFSTGMLPDSNLTSIPMQSMRKILSTLFEQ